MSKSSQQRAIANFRNRLSEKGLVRFEVTSRDSDRELVRTEANDCIVVADNERDFEDIQVINPIRGAT
jgi:hypothetical protein